MLFVSWIAKKQTVVIKMKILRFSPKSYSVLIVILMQMEYNNLKRKLEKRI